MSDIHDLTGVSPARITKLIESILLTVPDDELPVTIVYALAGCLGVMASRFKEPQVVLDHANDIALKAMQDTSALHNSKPDGEVH